MNRPGAWLVGLAVVVCVLAILGLGLPDSSSEGGPSPEGEPSASPSSASPPSSAPAPEAAEPSAEAPPCWVGLLLSRGTVDVVAETAGTLEALRVDVGDRVEAGQELAILASPDAEHQLREQQARVAVARSSLDGAKVEVGRTHREMERRQGAAELFSTEQIEAAQFELELAELEEERRRAALDEAQAALDRLEDLAQRRRLRAPFAGRISARQAVPGAALSPGQPVLRLVATAAPLVRFAVPAPTVVGLQPGTEVKVELASSPGSQAPTPEPVTALIETLAPVLDEASQLVFVEASAPAEAWSGYPVGAVTRVSTPRDLATHGSCRGRAVVVLPE